MAIGIEQVKIEVPPPQQIKSWVERYLDRSSKQRLEQYLKIWLAKAKEYAPIDTGALRNGHFYSVTSKRKGKVGFAFTSEQRQANRDRGNDPNHFYGQDLHRGIPAGWQPKRAGVGPNWLNKAYMDTTEERHRLLGHANIL